MFRKARRLHFVGIGGIGMSGIAEVLLNLGYEVSGSDLRESAAVRRLQGLGATVRIGHGAEAVHGADVVVVSSAVRESNVEAAEARRLGIPVIPRAEMLGELMRMKYGIAIAGSHGKTSTTSMIAQVLHRSGIDPTIVLGGRLAILGSNARLGRGELMLVEADESDGSFLRLTPTIAVVTSIDREHLDHFGDLAGLQDAFVDFLNRVPFYGTGIVCLDDPTIQAILPRLERRVATYGMASQADLVAAAPRFDGFTSRYDAVLRGVRLGEVVLRVPGRHSIQNSLATLAVALDLEIPFAVIVEHLAEFEGADRRFQVRGEAAGVTVVDDYGHHPTEIRATLDAAREGWGGRIVAIFQPHRYTRVRDLRDEFARSFYEADLVAVTDIYPAGEDPIDGVDADDLARAIEEHGHRGVIRIPKTTDVPAAIHPHLEDGDLVIALGAGDVTEIPEVLLELLRSGAAGKQGA
ncbi:MAG: UDP-N-acetylmuramate--L-alanine ligase [Acidobacteriota bacterium]